MMIKNNKAAVRRAYTAARAYINAHADKYGDETTVRLNALRVVRNQLIELLDEINQPRPAAFTNYGDLEKWFLNGARDIYQLVCGGGSVFPFFTTDVLRLFYTPAQAAKWHLWAGGRGPADYARADVMAVEADCVAVGLTHMWAALKATRN
jgi:hypothetical protein